MKVGCYASLPHYAAHLRPIWDALPDELRGESWSPRASSWWGPRLPPPNQRHVDAVMVAGFADAQRIGYHHPLVYVEHGAGQSYDGDPEARGNGSYSGGRGLDAVALFIAPNDHVADRWRTVYDTPVAVVGCPKLDPWHAGTRPRRAMATPTVALTFHWDCGLVPETRWALPHHVPALRPLRDAVRAAGGELLGHAHPRASGAVRALWADLGVPYTAELADILDHADVLVADNTSAMYEFASLDRPVVALNAPWYRRDIEHGLRFWSHVPGAQVDQPDDLVDVVTAALTDPAPWRALRQRAVQHVYAATDGQAASRAAAAIVEVLSAEPVPSVPHRHRV